jgi:Cu(I)/Ag(I) efflux system periplasmic protein CusF
MKLLCTVLATTLICTHVMAQTATTTTTTATPSASAPAATAPAAAPAKDMAEAEVRKVDKDAKKVTLKHGPIKNLDMPGMTMVFQVRDAALFDKLVVGEKIMFTAEQLQGAFVMTGAEKVAPK